MPLRRAATVVGVLLAVLAGMVAFQSTPAFAGVTVVGPIQYSPPGYPIALYLDVIKPTTGGPYPAVLVAHEGWSGGQRANATKWAKSLARDGFVAFSVDYRLVCINPSDQSCGGFRLQEDDLELAMTWIHQHGASYGWNGQSIGAIGGSGGATLVETLGVLAPPELKPQAVVSWSGQPEMWRFDYSSDPDTLQQQDKWYTGCPYNIDPQYDCPDRWHEVSAITYAASDNAPLYMATGQQEYVIPWQESVDFGEALDGVGVPNVVRTPPTHFHGSGLGQVVVWGCCTTVQDEAFAWLHTFLDPSPQAALSLTGIAPDAVPVEGSITYDLTISNAGPAWAPHTTLTDALPSDVHLVSATPSQGTCTGTDTVSCDLGAIPPDEDPVTVSITVGADAEGTAVSAPTVSSSVPDPDTSNNTVEKDVIIYSGGSLFSGVVKDADGTPIPGQAVTLSQSGGARFTTTSDTDGSFALGVPSDVYALDVTGGEADGTGLPTSYDASVSNFDLTGPVTSDVTLPLSPLDITIRGPGGNPVPGVAVSAPCTALDSFELVPGYQASGTECSGGAPDATGSEQLTLLPSSSLTVTATPPAATTLLPATVSGLSVPAQTDLAIDLLPQPSVYVSDPTVLEGGPGDTGMADFHLTLSNPSPNPVTVKVATGGGTATAGVDYQALATTLFTFAPGETQKSVEIPVYGDSLHEPNESIGLTMSIKGTGATVGDPTASATIVDDDGPLSLYISDSSAAEGGPGTTSPATFTLTLSDHPAPGQTVSVKVMTSDATAIAASGDYQSVPLTTITWTPTGSLTKTQTVTVNGDATAEPNETFLLKLSGASTNVTIADSSGTGTIIDDDGKPPTQPLPSLYVSDPVVVESASGGTPTATFALTLPAASANPVSLTVATANGTATAGGDYQALGPTVVTFPPGSVEQDVQVPVYDDSLHEGNETFQLNLSAPSGVSLADRAATATIVDDDGPLHVYASDGWAVEGNQGTTDLVFLVSLSDPLGPGQTVTVTVATSGGWATPGVDYQALPATTLTWTSADPLQKTVVVTVNGDSATEPNDVMFLKLSGGSGAALSDLSATGTIVNDD